MSQLAFLKKDLKSTCMQLSLTAMSKNLHDLIKDLETGDEESERRTNEYTVIDMHRLGFPAYKHVGMTMDPPQIPIFVIAGLLGWCRRASRHLPVPLLHDPSDAVIGHLQHLARKAVWWISGSVEPKKLEVSMRHALNETGVLLVIDVSNSRDTISKIGGCSRY